jgi:hypothetical protein
MKVASAITKEFLNVSSNHINRFLKAISNDNYYMFYQILNSVFLNPFFSSS